MVETRSSARKAPAPARENGHNGKSWAETHGVGDHSGAWGLTGVAGVALAYAGALLLMLGCPAFAIYMCGFLHNTVHYRHHQGLVQVAEELCWLDAELGIAFCVLGLQAMVHQRPALINTAILALTALCQPGLRTVGAKQVSPVA